MYNRKLPALRSSMNPTLWPAELDRVFNGFMNLRSFSPALDVIQEEGKMTYKLDLPGVSREDIKVDLQNGDLVISGERKSETTDQGYFERSYGSFTRRVSLPISVSKDDIEANLTDGVLAVTVNLPEQNSGEDTSIPVT